MADKDKYKYRVEIQQMMFVLGEVNDPPVETACVIEDVLRDQVVEYLTQATRNAALRGSKSILAEDIIFLIRHDRAKVNRLRTYLLWKDVRKNAKDQEGGGLENTDQLLDDPLLGELQKPGPGAGPIGPGAAPVPKAMNKRAKVKLPWELQFMFSEQPGENPADDDTLDDDEKGAIAMLLKRLKTADERTRNMTKEEYVHWSECRQLSFTYRKAKRFREWCGINSIMDSKPHDDVIDILGFLTFEMVCSITEEALRIKLAEEKVTKASLGPTRLPRNKKRHLFDMPEEMTRPILPRHVEEAWRQLQTPRIKRTAVMNFRGGRLKSKTQLI